MRSQCRLAGHSAGRGAALVSQGPRAAPSESAAGGAGGGRRSGQGRGGQTQTP